MRADEIATPAMHALGDYLPKRTLGRVAILEFTRRRIRRFDQDEQAAPLANTRDEGGERVTAEVRIYRHRVAAEVAVTKESLSVCGRGRADIAALGVGYRDEAERACECEDLGQCVQPVESAGLEKGELRLDCDYEGRTSLDNFAAETRERVAFP